jgi:hypothetical protein
MRQGRFITTAVAAVAAMAVGPAGAAAAPSPFVDDTVADFTATGAQPTGTWAVEPGQVRLRPGAVSENFDGSALPTGFAATPWPMGQTGPAQTGGNASVAGGTLTVDGAHFNDTNPAPTFTAPQTLEFRATFGTDQYQNVGLANTFDEPLWAMFSTGPASIPGTFFARTLPAGTTPDTAIDTTTYNPAQPHLYRIEWTATEVRFYIDNALVATHNAVIAGPMRPVVSDLNVDLTIPPPGGPVVKVDWLGMSSAATPGTFVSHVLAADDAHTVWGAVKETGLGTGATFETRSGKNPTFDSTWSDWEPVGSGGAIQSPSGRQYIQYKATLSSAGANLDKVALDYAVDTTAPSAAVNSVDVSGTTANLTFSSPDLDTIGFECSLDGGAPATCTSPKTLADLAVGSHTVTVRAVDKAGNFSTPDSRTFSIASPSAPGGTTQSGGSSAADKTAPKVSLVARSLRASKRGTVSFRVGCPATETRCKVQLQLKDGKKVAAKKTVTVNGGKTVTVTLQLTTAARQALAKHGSLKVSTVFTATDAAGNHKTTTRRMTLRRAAA